MKNIILCLLFVTFCCISLKGKTEPLLITFAEMMEQTETIVIAHYRGMPNNGVFGPYLLEVSEIIKGNVNTDIIEASIGAGQVDLAIGTECIAFLKEDNSFEWVATIDGEQDKEIRKAILSVRGFYDYNAYIVYPSVMTLSQIKDYLKTLRLDYNLEGYLHFFSDESRQIEKSDIYFSVSHSYLKDSSYSQVNSENLTVIDFPEQPEVGILSLYYETNLVRPLEITSEIITNQENIFQVNFWVETPEEITYEDFRQYLQKPEWGHIYYELELHHKGEIYPFIYDEELGRIGNLEGFENRVLACQSLSREALEFRLGDDIDLVIEFEEVELDKNLIKYSSESFIRELRLNNFQGRVFKVKNDEVVEDLGECELSFKAFHFAVNPNFGK